MTNMTELIKNLRGASVRLYLLKKEGRKNFSAFRMPNGIDDDIKEKYCTNLEHFIDGRSFGTYDFVHTEKNALIELETEKVSMWTSIQASLKKADDENVFLKISMMIIKNKIDSTILKEIIFKINRYEYEIYKKLKEEFVDE